MPSGFINGQKLKQYRKKCGWSLESLGIYASRYLVIDDDAIDGEIQGSAIAIHPVTLSRYENQSGKSCNLKYLYACANAIAVRLKEDYEDIVKALEIRPRLEPDIKPMIDLSKIVIQPTDKTEHKEMKPILNDPVLEKIGSIINRELAKISNRKDAVSFLVEYLGEFTGIRIEDNELKERYDVPFISGRPRNREESRKTKTAQLRKYMRNFLIEIKGEDQVYYMVDIKKFGNLVLRNPNTATIASLKLMNKLRKKNEHPLIQQGSSNPFLDRILFSIDKKRR